MPESVKRRGSSGPTIGATERSCWSGRSSVVAMWPQRLRADRRPLRCHEMRVTVRLFAVLRERAGSESVELELPDGATVSDAIAAVPVAEGVPVVMAVNREVAPGDAVLSAGDELALIPPVSGGAIHTEPLSLDALVEQVRDPRAGAVVTFSGVTREIDFLDYQAYAEMAAEQ